MSNQEENSLNELYFKVQNVIKYAKMDKYVKDQEEIQAEGITFFGSITGKNNLQIERLRNVKLKIELLESQKVKPKEDVSAKDLMADMQACAMSELGGKFNDDMTKLYKEIEEKATEKVTKNEVYELAYQKVSNGQSYLPVIHTDAPKGIFGDIKVQTEFLKLENKKLENQIILERGKSQFKTFSLKNQKPRNNHSSICKIGKKCLTKRTIGCILFK